MALFEYGKSNLEAVGKLETIKVKITCDRLLTSVDAVGQLAVLLGLGDTSVRNAFPELMNMQKNEMLMFTSPIDEKGNRHFDVIGYLVGGKKKFHLRVVLKKNGFQVLRANKL